MMPLISDDYRTENARLHARNPHYGVGGALYKDAVAVTCAKEGHTSVLDYGCGKGTLKLALPSLDIREYDPAIPGKDADPEPADLLICTDVLEHIEPMHLNAVLKHIASKTKRKVMLNIATREAEKTLSDGRNAHLIVRDADWWRGRLLKHFQITEWAVVPGSKVYCEAFPIRGRVLTRDDMSKRRRRALTPPIRSLHKEIIDQSARYADKFSRIETISMWEGVDDTPADMIMAAAILEDVADIDGALHDMIKLARKMVMVSLTMDENRNEAMWRRVFERKFRITDWHVEGQKILFGGAPQVNVEGINAIGAVQADDRWDQVLAACRRIPGRIETGPERPERIALVCYGPSLADDMVQEHLKARIKDGAIVVSVSGAHDWLLARGIVPNFHVECDPRPHKALNIDKSHPDVTYLMGSVVHKDVLDRLEGADVRLWHVASSEHQRRLVDELGEKGEHIISGGGSVGLRALTLLYAMGFRDYSVYGMDSSFRFPADIHDKAVELALAEKHEEMQELVQSTQQWAGRHFGKRQDVVPVDCGGTILFSSPQLLTYATYFFETAQRVEGCRFELIGDGLLQRMAQLYAGLEQAKSIEAEAATAA